MDDHSQVLCPLSGSSRNERALAIAAGAAALFKAQLVLFSAVADRHEVSGHESYLQRQAAAVRIEYPELDVVVRVVVDPHAPEAITAEAVDNTLVVMATSTQPFLHDGYIGSAAESVIRWSARPALLVGPKVDVESGPWSPARIIVPVDGSPVAEAAVPVGLQWAARLDLPVWLIHVVTDTDRTAEEAQAPARARAEELGVDWEILHHHDPAVALAAAAGTDGLIVISSHGRSGLRRIAMGSVATDTVRRSLAPVLVVAPRGEDGGDDSRDAARH